MTTRQSTSSLSRSSHVPALTHCIHTLTQEENSVLSLAATEKLLFSGGQGAHGSDIHVWDLEHFQLKANLKGHLGSILSLSLSDDDGKWLFSSSGDGTVRVWDTTTFKCLYHIHSSQDVGDIFSVVYSQSLNTMYIGCQNTSIQWFDFLDTRHETDVPQSPNITHSLRSQTPLFFEGSKEQPEEQHVIRYSIPDSGIYQNSHFGYVYCLLLGKVPNVEGEILFSGSGEGDIKLWKLRKGEPIELWRTLKAGVDASTLTLALHDGFLFCGSQGGNIKIFDLETFQLIRSLIAHEDDVLALVVRAAQVFSASADGVVKQWNRSFEPLQTWADHTGSVLSLTSTKDFLISGGSDKLIKLWKINDGPMQVESVDTAGEDVMLYALEKWIAMPTVSGVPSQLEECRRGAKFLKAVLQQLGAEARLIPGAPGQNPLVYGQFSARSIKSDDQEQQEPQQHRPLNVLVYGHYDVIAADSKKWDHPPFELTGKDGYLYGRGASDNKGPILACIFAASELQEEQQLDVNVKFLIEGEEENGSVGFFQAVDQNMKLFEEADVILLSNSYWLGEDIPCLTYGLRGVIHSTLTITSKNKDLHSGVDGGAVSEPLIDMVKVLSELVNPDRTAKIPGFYDCIRPLSSHEDALYDPIVEDMFNNPSGQRHWDPTATGVTKEELKKKLMARWRTPSLTIHQVDVSGPKNRTVIPRSAKASVSMRIVPDQEVADITKSFEEHIDIKVVADWWLGDTKNRFFKAAESAIEQEWGQKPLFIREGGSVPAIRWLEKRLKAAAVHIPMGQSSDQAHLNNERIRLQNLNTGKRVIKTFLRELRSLEVAEHTDRSEQRLKPISKPQETVITAMGEFFEEISASLIEWIKKQHLFFVATAPIDGRKVNVSPKGYDALRVINPNRVCYLELTGSGIETQSHLEENGRITVMLCAFDGSPKIVRLWGTGHIHRVDTPEFDELLEAHYQDSDIYNAISKRSIIVVDIDSVGVSCGWAVPYMEFKSERPTHKRYWKSKTEVDVNDFWIFKNTFSLDGLPAMRHERMGPEWATHDGPQQNRKKGKGNVVQDLLKNGSLLANVSLVTLGAAAGIALARRFQ
ncbi:hypothetical protein BG004_002995 [Podila humilis]|nr:hypothetical protein BG004_002995 [Podila humilis]